MNVLLANMPIKFNLRENLEPPLGICYIGSVLKENGHAVHLKDYEVENLQKEKLKTFLEKEMIDVVGISFRTASYKSSKEFSAMIKEINSDIKIALGGQHATAFPKETLKDIEADFAIKGEGEYVFRDLLSGLEEKKDLSFISGITYKLPDGNIISNNDREPIADIDALPMPLREALPLGKYNIITIITSRGCPFDCIYCDKGVSTRVVKYRSPEKVFEEIRYIAENLGKKRLYIVDDYFFLHKKRLETILDKVIEEKIPITWVCQARVDGIDGHIIEKAKNAGCEQIMFGIESGDERELKYIRKKATNEQAENAVKSTKSYDIIARANFMLGFPISTRDMLENTIRFARKIHPDIVRFFAVSPLPNTDLWRELYGDKFDADKVKWDNVDFFKPNFDTVEIKREEISLYVTAAYLYTLKKDFLKEITLYLIPNLSKLAYLWVKTGKLRGNISKSFPRSVNLILDGLHQIGEMPFSEKVIFLKNAWKLQKKI